MLCQPDSEQMLWLQEACHVASHTCIGHLCLSFWTVLFKPTWGEGKADLGLPLNSESIHLKPSLLRCLPLGT